MKIRMRRCFLGSALIALVVLAFAAGGPKGLAAPGIEITFLPPFGSFENLVGRVSNLNPADGRVAVYIYLPGAGWFTKPTCSQSLTPIQPDGTWVTDITTGGIDERATRITALLVRPNFSEPCALGVSAVPASALEKALASVTVTRDDPTIRRLVFSGYEWLVKASTAVVGPGPNLFSDSTTNVWLDAQNRLHLRITKRNDRWECAEVYSRRSFGHGFYRFYLDTPIDVLDANMVAGFFTWSDDPDFLHREVDIEFTRWGVAADPENAQFVVQPFGAPGHQQRFTMPAGLAQSTHIIKWETNLVSFQSYRGHLLPPFNPANRISEWGFSPSPPAGDENFRMNLWLYEGRPPLNGQEAELIINRFEFVPFGEPRPARLTDLNPRPNGQVLVHIAGEFDRRYAVRASTALPNWSTLGTVLATNANFTFLDTNASGFPRRFYQAITLP
jgi:hypothetical protein